ncbi:hypothetical protein VNO77_21165 [Canavalia gladiata]|uniref:F-box domain-containing protein n=1 Tax=Canavalia gladiata TaxID=3824 RepID=A0AAN9LV18_CANGL
MAEIMCHNKSHSKPTTIEDLNDELLIEILHRFPLPFLLQCKSVNKRFLSVISDPHFFNPRLIQPRAFENHTLFPLLFHFYSGFNYHKKILFCLDSKNQTHILMDSYFLPPFWHQDRDRFRVKATHRDLVLCSTHNNFYIHYFVCNPFTKRHVVLPQTPKSHAQEFARVGFINDQCRSRFRVVHIPVVCFENVSSFQVHVFSSETGEWRVSNVDVPRAVLMSDSYPTNVIVYKGALLWWMKEHGFLVCDDPFDGWDSKWRIVRNSCAVFYGSRRWDICNGVCNGRVKTFAFKATRLESIVYRLDDDFHKTTWSCSEYRFNLEDAVRDHELVKGVGVNNMKLLAFHPQCEYIIYFYSSRSIFLYKCNNRKLETLYTVEDEGEDLHVLGNALPLVLPEWPTPIPTLK